MKLEQALTEKDRSADEEPSLAAFAHVRGLDGVRAIAIVVSKSRG